MHAFRVESFIAGQIEQRLNYVCANLRSTGSSGYTKAITTAGDFNIEAAFYLAQVFVKLAAKIG